MQDNTIYNIYVIIGLVLVSYGIYRAFGLAVMCILLGIFLCAAGVSKK